MARESREDWFRASREARAREEEVRGGLRGVVDRLEAVKKSLEDLREERRLMVGEFRKQEEEWRRQVERGREEARRRSEEERRRAAEEREREEEELRAKAEPYIAERSQVKLLLRYCEAQCSPSLPPTPPPQTPPSSLGSFLLVPGTSRRRSSGFSTTSTGSSHYATPLGHTPLQLASPPSSPPELAEGVFSRKSSMAETTPLLCPCSQGGKRGKREARRRRSSNTLLGRQLAHSPDVWAQFAGLGLNPPLTGGGVAETLAKLRTKLDELEHRAAKVKLARLSVGGEGVAEEAEEVEEAEEATAEEDAPALSDSKQLLLPQVSVNYDSDDSGGDTLMNSCTEMVIRKKREEEKDCPDKKTTDLLVVAATRLEAAPIILLTPADDAHDDEADLAEDTLENAHDVAGPLIQITDCDIADTSSTTNGMISNSCIIAR